MNSFIIVGGGLSGCTMAYLLKNKHPKASIRIFEEKEIGGLCKTYSCDGIQYELGPHVLYTGASYLREFFEKFVTNKEMKYYQKLSIDGTLDNPYSFPVSVGDVIRVNPKAAVELYNVNTSSPDYSNMENYFISRVGRTAYEYFYKNYNIKQWGVHPRKMETEWISQRKVFLRDSVESVFGNKWQGHPGSYNSMFDKMVSGVKIVPEKITSIDTKTGIVKSASGEYSADLILNTAPLDLLFEGKNELGYRGIAWVYTLLSMERAMPTYLMSFPNNYGFTRILEYKQQSQQSIPGKTLISFDYPFDSKDDSEPVSESYVREINDYLKLYFPDKLITIFVESRRLVYPISEKKSIDHFWRLLTDNVSDKWISLGRLGLYSYISMDTCVDICMKIADIISAWGGMNKEGRLSFYRNLREKQT